MSDRARSHGTKFAPALLGALALVAASSSATDARGGEITLHLARGALTDTLFVDAAPVGVIEHEGHRETLRAGSLSATIVRRTEAFSADRPFPQRVTTEGRRSDGGPVLREEYVLLAPPAPIRVEGLGLELATDPPGRNAAEHAALRAWLREQGLPEDTVPFEQTHRADSGRDLRTWYEVSGRRVQGAIGSDREGAIGSDREGAIRSDHTGGAEARFDSLFHATAEGLKLHHARELFYHRESLELVDVLRGRTGAGEIEELREYECGCYGWTIGGDVVTLGDRLYHVIVEWMDHRVGAGLSLGLQRRAGFPWIGFGDRTRMQLLAGRTRAYRLTDARESVMAEITSHPPDDPGGDALGPGSYDIRVHRDGIGLAPLARIRVTPEEIVVTSSVRSSTSRGGIAVAAELIDALDTLFASMPAQIARGDGIRDSHLGAVETLIDWLRFVRAPGETTLADVVSDVDALTAVAKVDAFLRETPERFVASAQERPLPPQRATSSPFRAEASLGSSP